MILRSLFAASVTLLLLLAACSSGESATEGDPPAEGSQPIEAEQTREALRELAEREPVADYVRAYVAQLCAPLRNFADATRDVRSRFEAAATEEGPGFDEGATLENDNFEEEFDFLAGLNGPLATFVEHLQDIDPPDGVREYHDAIVDQIEYLQAWYDAVREGSDDAIEAYWDIEPPAEPEQPAGFDAALILECDEFVDMFDGFDSDFRSTGTSGFALPDALEDSGGMGDVVTSGGFELVVHAVADPVTPASVSGEQNPGRRWLAVDVSFTNVARETRDYAERDYTVQIAGEVRYAPGFFELADSLGAGSLAPGETVRGWVGFAVPISATVVLLVFDPEAHSETKIEIDLQ